MERTALSQINWTAALALIIGLTALNVWPDMTGHGLAFAAAADAISPLTNGRVFFSFGMFLCTFLFALRPRQLSHMTRWLRIAIPAASIAATVVFFFCGDIESLPLAILCSLFIGFGYGWYLVQLLVQLSRVASIRSVIVAVVASLLLKTLADDLCGLAAAPLQAALTAAMPLVMSVALSLMGRETNSSQVVDVAELPKLEGSSHSVLIGLLAINAVLHAVTRALSPLGLWGGSFIIQGGVDGSLALIAITLIAAVALTMAHLEEGDVIVRFLPAFLLLLGGYFALDSQTTTFVGMPSWLASSLTTALELYAHTLYWMIIVTGVRSLALPPLRVIGLTVAIMDLTAMVLALFVQNFAGMSHMVVMTAMYLFVFVMVVLFRNARSDQKSAREHESADDLHSTCLAIADQAHLTPRETEVFLLLAQGRDRAFIQEELYITEGTIKTHSQHIYAKLGVHNKQELISLVRTRSEE